MALQNLLRLQSAKLTETICFADCSFSRFFNPNLFRSKYSKKLRFLDSNTEGFESIGFDIPLYASLVVRRKPLQKTHCGKVKKTPQNQRRTEYGFEGERYPISSSTVRRRLITVGRKERRPVQKQRKAFNQSNETNDRSGKKKYKD